MNLDLLPDALPKLISGGGNAKSDSWFTPSWITDWLPPIALDPCWHEQSNVRADVTLCLADGQDGLSRPWSQRLLDPVMAGQIVWVNPPYNDCSRWVERCAEEAARLPIPVVALVPAYAGDAYWHRAVWGKAAYVGSVRGRVRFDIAPNTPAKDSASFCSALIIWGAEAEAAGRAIAQRAGDRVFWVEASKSVFEGAK